jgi:hypothetical protein
MDVCEDVAYICVAEDRFHWSAVVSTERVLSRRVRRNVGGGGRAVSSPAVQLVVSREELCSVELVFSASYCRRRRCCCYCCY